MTFIATRDVHVKRNPTRFKKIASGAGLLLSGALSLAACGVALAQVSLDDFSNNQGPFIADPMNPVTDDPATVLLDPSGVLGEARIMLGSMTVDAGTGSTTTVEVTGNEWTCDIDFASSVGDGACSVAYDRACGERHYDFSQVTSFNLTASSVDGPAFLNVWVTDRNGVGGFGFVSPFSTGVNSIPPGFIFAAGPVQLDWTGITSISFGVSNDPTIGSVDTSTVITGISATGTVALVVDDESQCTEDPDLVFKDGFEDSNP